MHASLLLIALLLPVCGGLDQEAARKAVPASIPQQAAMNVLQSGLQGSDPEYRMMALKAAGSIGPMPEAINLVAEGLRDKDPMVRQTAASMLGEMQARSATPALRTAMDDNFPEVRFAAAKALFDLGDTSGLSLIQQVLLGERKDGPPLLKGKIEEAKRTLHEPSQLAVLGIKQALGALPGPFGMGASSAEELLSDRGSPGRAIAADILSAAPDPDALPLLEWALTDRSWMVRAAAAKALGTRGNAASVDKLAPLLTDPHHLARFMAAASILKIGFRGLIK